MVQPKNKDALSRRVFLKRGATLASAAPFVINLAACSSSSDHETGEPRKSKKSHETDAGAHDESSASSADSQKSEIAEGLRQDRGGEDFYRETNVFTSKSLAH